MAGSVITPPSHPRRSSERGYVLISLYAILALLTGYGAALVTHAAAELQSAQRSQASLQAMYAAEGGIDQAIVQLRANPNWAGGSGSLGATTTYAVAVQSLGGNRQRLTVQGSSPLFQGTVSRSVEAIVQTSSSLFPQGVFGNQSVTMSGNAFTNSYTSSQGPYNPLRAGAQGHIGTNGVAAASVRVSGNARINGNATVGPGGNPATAISRSGNARITGTSSAATALTPMPPVTVPSGVADRGALSISGNTRTTLPGGTYWYDSLSITGNGGLSFSGPATLYISGNVQIAGNGIWTAGNVPPNLVVYVVGAPSVQFSGNGQFSGAVYAPQAAVSVSGNGEIYGALVGNTVTVSGNGGIHYDTALQALPGGGSGQVTVLSWQDLS